MIGISPARNAHLILRRSRTTTPEQHRTQILERRFHLWSLIRFHARDYMLNICTCQPKKSFFLIKVFYILSDA